MASKFTRIEYSGLLRTSGLSEEPFKTEDNLRSKGNAATDSLTQGPIDKPIGAKGVHFTVHNNCSVVLLYYFSMHGVICGTVAWDVSSTPKLLGGITVMLIT